MKITIAELNAIKEKMKDSVAIRKHADGVRIVVAMGTCGIAAGARDVLQAFVKELHGVKKITVEQSGCIGNCANEPIVRIITPDDKTITYVKMNAAKAKKVAESILSGGEPISEYQA